MNIKLFLRAVSVVALYALIAGCTNMGGHGPSAKKIRTEESGYHLVQIVQPSQIPIAIDPFTPSKPPPMNSQKQYLEELTTRDQLEILITDASSPSSPFYREGGTYTYGPVEVPRSGKIKIPYIGEIDVIGRSLAQVSQEVSQKVKEVASSAEVAITRPFRLEKRANILGEVQRPGPVEIDRKGFTVLDVLAAAGGTKGPEHIYIINLQREGNEYQYDSTTLRQKSILAQDGDLIRVVKNPSKIFIVAGAVNRPGRIDFPVENPTLADALAYAGGLDEHSSDPNGVFVFRNRGNKQEMAYAIDMKATNAIFLANRFLIEGGDSIYISEAPLTQWNRFIGSILPSGQATKMGAGAAVGVPGAF